MTHGFHALLYTDEVVEREVVDCEVLVREVVGVIGVVEVVERDVVDCEVDEEVVVGVTGVLDLVVDEVVCQGFQPGPAHPGGGAFGEGVANS